MIVEIATIAQIILVLFAALWLGVDRLAERWFPVLSSALARIVWLMWLATIWVLKFVHTFILQACYVYINIAEGADFTGTPDTDAEYQSGTAADTTAEHKLSRTEIIQRGVALGLSANQIAALAGGNRNAVLAEIRSVRDMRGDTLRVTDADGTRFISRD